MDIKITQTFPKIGIETQNAKLDLKNNGKIDFTISHTEPKILMNSTKPKIYIDQTKCFSDAGLKGINDFMAEAVQLAKQRVLEFIEKKAQQGDMLAKIENKSKPILDAVKQDITNNIDYNVGLMPQHSPEIYTQMGEIKIQLIEGEIQTIFNYTPIEGTYIPPQIKFYLLQKGSVTIEYIGKSIDTKI